jgi:hypothetical protein
MNDPSYKMLERDINGNTVLKIYPLQTYINYSSQTINNLYKSLDYTTPSFYKKNENNVIFPFTKYQYINSSVQSYKNL